MHPLSFTSCGTIHITKEIGTKVQFETCLDAYFKNAALQRLPVKKHHTRVFNIERHLDTRVFPRRKGAIPS
jgi:hypothetical protein